MTGIEAIKQEWDQFQKAVKAIRTGDTVTLRRVNHSLGYNMVQSVPYLVDELNAVLTIRERDALIIASMKSQLTELREELQKIKKGGIYRLH